MKATFAAVALLASFASFACPRLAGNYTCTISTDGDPAITTTMNFGQLTLAGKERYIVDIAQGDESGTLYLTVGVASESGEVGACNGNVLTITDGESAVSYSKSGRNLVVRSSDFGESTSITCPPVR